MMKEGGVYMGQINIKRAYEETSDQDGFRVLVDRLWPRGISRERARLDQWAKEITPSSGLRQAYHRGEIGWNEFRQAYLLELRNSSAFSQWSEEISFRLDNGPVTFLTAASCQQPCHVHVLIEALGR